MGIKISIKLKMLALLFGLITMSIIVVGYMGIVTIINAGTNAKQTSSVTLKGQAETFLVQLTEATAEKNDILFENVRISTGNLASYTEKVFDSPKSFAKDKFWQFDEHIILGEKGQHLNGMDDISSVFIPNHVDINDKEVREEAEMSAYLDFNFPQILENNPNTAAIWYIGIKDVSRYYPNIGLGNIAPADQVSTNEPFFTVAAPKENPDKKTVWTPPYDDPAGQGLMISSVAPIYLNQKGFSGVLGIDITLNNIIKTIEEYSPLERSYSFLMDREGFSIALPEKAYIDFFGRPKNPEESRADLNKVSNVFSAALNNMKSGKKGFDTIQINNKKLYIAYAPLEKTGFSLGMIVEEEVMLKAVSTLDRQTEKSTQDLIFRQILPVGVFILFIALSLGLLFANIIVDPIKKLTDTGKLIADGKIDSQMPEIKSNDEIQDLSNTMALLVGAIKFLKKEEHKEARKK
ncbi:MAG: cache domain-containing protein [archaeon]